MSAAGKSSGMGAVTEGIGVGLWGAIDSWGRGCVISGLGGYYNTGRMLMDLHKGWFSVRPRAGYATKVLETPSSLPWIIFGCLEV